jgi:hypothetical protein
MTPGGAVRFRCRDCLDELWGRPAGSQGSQPASFDPIVRNEANRAEPLSGASQTFPATIGKLVWFDPAAKSGCCGNRLANSEANPEEARQVIEPDGVRTVGERFLGPRMDFEEEGIATCGDGRLGKIGDHFSLA